MILYTLKEHGIKNIPSKAKTNTDSNSEIKSVSIVGKKTTTTHKVVIWVASAWDNG